MPLQPPGFALAENATMPGSPLPLDAASNSWSVIVANDRGPELAVLRKPAKHIDNFVLQHGHDMSTEPSMLTFSSSRKFVASETNASMIELEALPLPQHS
jgi:hypothetical protein